MDVSLGVNGPRGVNGSWGVEGPWRDNGPWGVVGSLGVDGPWRVEWSYIRKLDGLMTSNGSLMLHSFSKSKIFTKVNFYVIYMNN